MFHFKCNMFERQEQSVIIIISLNLDLVHLKTRCSWDSGEMMTCVGVTMWDADQGVTGDQCSGPGPVCSSIMVTTLTGISQSATMLRTTPLHTLNLVQWSNTYQWRKYFTLFYKLNVKFLQDLTRIDEWLLISAMNYWVRGRRDCWSRWKSVETCKSLWW